MNTTTRRQALRGLGLAAAAAAGGCVSIGSPDKAALQGNHLLRDSGALGTRREQPLVPALVIQPLPGSAMADTVSIAYSLRPFEFAYYQLAGWTERPVRLLPRLLKERLERQGLAGAVALMGEPLYSDWLLTVSIDALHHDVATPPGHAVLSLAVELFDRRARSRVARRIFEARQPVERADSASAAAALSRATSITFDQLVPWLEAELQRATTTGSVR